MPSRRPKEKLIFTAESGPLLDSTVYLGLLLGDTDVTILAAELLSQSRV